LSDLSVLPALKSDLCGNPGCYHAVELHELVHVELYDALFDRDHVGMRWRMKCHGGTCACVSFQFHQE
jgi:hypothetical protein